MKASRTGCVVTVCSALAFPSVANGQGTSDSADSGPPGTQADAFAARLGPQVGARLAYTDGLGVVYQGVNLSDAASGALPILIDVGWRFLPQLYVGVYGQFAPVFLKTYQATCPAGVSCAAQDWRFGVEVDYHFPPRLQLDPYVGLGVGYEILQSSFHGSTNVPQVTAQGTTLVPTTFDESFTDRGWEFVSLTVGVDWRFSSTFGVGLFLMGSVGEYDTETGNILVTTSCGTQNPPVPPIQPAAHELAFIGLRGSFNP
jgi:opacity protein-like surface antigen